ncbi:hypothetical protein DFJ67_6501 [Asanoa ferruginea]|uniref:WD40 repeat protein n=1 Tax=Asanoa ferruginea TaxID=53367 RepID=A0A3D9ZSS9_9ACTN|nr:hypothetical protein [Asanoa ferruginea]REG00447.1 hypothetical protein DFJ67_6501 [Asanoa ferruginea]GIF50978.1 hypothetical protein Afe04nite_55170 [Asanoa ferruginea]
MISEQHVAESIRAAVDAIPVEPPPSGAVRARARVRRRNRRRVARMWPAAIATMAVFAIVMGATVALTVPRPTPGGTEFTPYRLPTYVAGASESATVSKDPPGRAIALFTRNGRKVVLATDGVSYRDLDPADQTDAALLSPDGLAVVLSDPTAVTGVVDVVDLRTGRVEHYPVDPTAALRPLAWSPDSRRVAFATQATPTDNGAGPAGVSVLDLETRDFVRVADSRPDTGRGRVLAAFTTWGASVLVSAGAEPGCTLRLYRLEQPAPADPVAVDGPVARCSEVATLGLRPSPEPDRPAVAGVPPMLLVVGEYLGNIRRLSFRGGSLGVRSAEPATIAFGPDDKVLGWDGSDALYVASTSEVTRRSVDGRSLTTMVRFPSGAVGGFQLAADLVPRSTPLDVDAALLPLSPLRTAAVILLVLGVAALVVLVVLLRRRRRAADR